MTKRFQDKTVVITGASAGIGLSTARAFAKEGAKVALLARNKERLEHIKEELESQGVEVLIFPIDVSDPKRMEEVAGKIEAEWGIIDVWVNNAMVSVFSEVMEMTADDYRRVTEVTYLGYVWGTQAALKRMLPRNEGVIIEVGSALAYRGIPLQSAYCAAKHAVRGFVDSLKAELAHNRSKVKVIMVQLPAHNTPQFDWVKSRLDRRGQPVPPIYQPEVAARAILFAASSNRREVLVGFPTVGTKWLSHFFPGLVDKYLGRTGYDSQQTSEREDSKRPNNVFDTVPGDFGAHGRFDQKAKNNNLHLLITMNRKKLLAAGSIAFVILSAFLKKRRQYHKRCFFCRR